MVTFFILLFDSSFSGKCAERRAAALLAPSLRGSWTMGLAIGGLWSDLCILKLESLKRLYLCMHTIELNWCWMTRARD